MIVFKIRIEFEFLVGIIPSKCGMPLPVIGPRVAIVFQLVLRGVLGRNSMPSKKDGKKADKDAAAAGGAAGAAGAAGAGGGEAVEALEVRHILVEKHSAAVKVQP